MTTHPHPTRRSGLRRGLAATCLLAVVAAGTSGCTSEDSPEPTTPTTSVAAAPSGVAMVGASPQDFSDLMEKDGTVLLDVRTPAEYAEGHLKGATLINFESPDFAQKIEKLDRSATYALYCRTGRRSGLAVQQMQAAGFTNVLDLAGGIVAWQGSGRKVVTE